MSATAPTSQEISDYMAENYGSCARGAAQCYHGPGCLKLGWKGRACQHWRPVGWTEITEVGRAPA